MMKNLVSARWLSDNMHRDDLVILDCSVEIAQDAQGIASYQNGWPLYVAEHIPGAGHADLIDDLSDPQNPHLCALPTADAFARKMATAGVGDDTTVVLYDRSFTAWAARVWWMLRWIGFDRALILDGGLKAWTGAGFAVSDTPHPPRARQLSAKPRDGVIADKVDVLSATQDGTARLIDTLDPDSFSGRVCKFDRAGHIPGAQNAYTLDLFDKDGPFKPADQLAALLDGDKGQPQVTYCGAGILAAATAFIMVQLGYRDVSVYVASLQEWAADRAMPMATA